MFKGVRDPVLDKLELDPLRAEFAFGTVSKVEGLSKAERGHDCDPVSLFARLVLISVELAFDVNSVESVR